MSKVQILNLKPSGTNGCTPDPEDWKTRKNSLVAIVNSSGADQDLTNITADMLEDQGGNGVTSISVKKDGFWLGTVTSKKGQYTYNDGLPAAGPRVGTIDPS